MDSYGLSLDELRTTCHRVAAEIDEIAVLADEVATSEVVSTDFGADSAAGSAYVDVTHGVLADSLKAFGAAGDQMIARLLATFAEYQRVDEDNGMRFRF